MKKGFISELARKQSSSSRRRKGFTLIELLVVIVIIALLAAVIFVALDPARRFADSRNARRWNDVNSILTAVREYIADNDGVLPTGLSAGMMETQLGTDALGCITTLGGSACGTSAACVDLSTPLAKYLASIPQDPSGGTAAKTGFSIIVDADNLVMIKACNAELGVTIQVAR